MLITEVNWVSQPVCAFDIKHLKIPERYGAWLGRREKNLYINYKCFPRKTPKESRCLNRCK